MEFEWDEAKRRANLSRHGIDFETAIAIWESIVLEVPSSQAHHGEERFLAIGQIEGHFLTLVFTWRGNRRRIISARRARRNERENYEKAIKPEAER